MSRRRVPADYDQAEVELEVHQVDGDHLKLQYTSSTYRHARLAAHYRGINKDPKENVQKRVTLLEGDGGIQISGIKVENVTRGDGSYSVEIRTDTRDDADFLFAALKLPGMTCNRTSTVATISESHNYTEWYGQINRVPNSRAGASFSLRRSARRKSR